MYMSIWSRYEGWCRDRGMTPFISSSANLYIASIFRESPTLTVKKRRNALQAILRKINNPGFTLQKIRSRIQFKRKKTYLGKLQLDKFFEDLKTTDYPSYIAQYIQLKLGIRINAVANLKVEHLLFLVNPDHLVIVVPDHKTGHHNKQIDQQLADLLKDYIQKENITGYLFSAGREDDPVKRSYMLGRKINRCIKTYSKTNTNSNLPLYTNHDYRRTYCENSKSEIMKKEILKQVSEKINHKNPYVTKNHYLLKETIDLDFDEIVTSVVDKASKDIPVRNNIRPPVFKVCRMSESEAKLARDSLFDALKEKKIIFNDDLIFRAQPGSTVQVQEITPEDLEVYKKFKEQSRQGFNAPVKVVYDDVQGYIVKATKFIDRYTLIAEYSGEVVEYDPNMISETIMEFIGNLVIEVVSYYLKVEKAQDKNCEG
jgi:integrase